MSNENILKQLLLLPTLDTKRCADILFNLGNTNPEFLQLLALTHSAQNRKILNSLRDEGVLRVGTSRGKLVDKINTAISGTQIWVSTEEYAMLFTLVQSDYITQSLRDKLKTYLGYKAYSISAIKYNGDKECAICSNPASKVLCSKCDARTKRFLMYRRESFTLPINYLNYPALTSLNIDGEFNMPYYDWTISKTKGDSVVECVLERGLHEGFIAKQYPLPFIEEQKVINLSKL